MQKQFNISTQDEALLLLENYQSIVVDIGQWFTEDEKLQEYTGENGWMRRKKVKDVVGTWIYEGTIRLEV